MLDLPQLQPYDEHNQSLQANVHPEDWINPKPSGKYNLVVVGAGTAGLVSAAIAAGLGAKVALIERELMGGDCLNVGCVPSKALITAARILATIRRAGEFGIRVPDGVTVDFPAVMERMRRLRASISPHDSAKRFQEMGVDVYLGEGKFTTATSIVVAGTELEFAKAAICTGARAAKLPIPGLDEAGFLTNETVFSLTDLPKRLAVVGGGPIGSELAQCFARFGSEVTLIEKHERILPKDDAEAAQRVQKAMQRDGVRFFFNTQIEKIERAEQEKVFHLKQNAETHELRADEILLGVGRQPNVESLDLPKAGVEFDVHKGIQVDDTLQTSNPNIYAAGDCCSKFKFTHAADFMARALVYNAIINPLPVKQSKLSSLTIPHCTYTSPELAHVGLTAAEAREQEIAVETVTMELRDNDRALLDGETEGCVMVHLKKGSPTIVGATVVAANAGDLIGELSLAMTHNLSIEQVAAAIHPYPTQADAIRRTGDLYKRTKLTASVKWAFDKYFAWRR